jgi:predicted lipopolysaccharide heptosyltransferase III
MDCATLMSILTGYNQRKLKYGLFIDRILGRILTPFKNKMYPPISAPKTILVIQSHRIGDLIMATPILRALKKKYPNSRICLLANEFAKDLLEGSPYIDELITMKFPWSTYDYSFANLFRVLKVIKILRKNKFDLAIDAQIDIRNAFLMFLAGSKRRLGYDVAGGHCFLTDVPAFSEQKTHLLEARLSILEYLGIDCSDNNTELLISKKASQWVELYLAQNNIDKDKLIAIHPGASVSEKCWQPANFAKIINHLKSKDYQSVIIEGPNDHNIVNSILSMTDSSLPRVKTNLKNVTALINQSRLLICVDSAAIHLAGAVGTPAVAIYGPQPPDLTKPLNDNIHSIWIKDFICRPCEYGRCKQPDRSCMNTISAYTVINEIDNILMSVKHPYTENPQEKFF